LLPAAFDVSEGGIGFAFSCMDASEGDKSGFQIRTAHIQLVLLENGENRSSHHAL
jgi:hypothetical protein